MEVRAMVLTRWDRVGIDIPERWRRWFDADVEREGWLRVEEMHDGDTLVIRVELPGVNPDKDIDVTVNDGVLQISARREKRDADKSKNNGYRSEFHYGEFSRNLALPAGVDKSAVTAEYKDGILKVTVPWPAEPEPGSQKVLVERG